MKRTSDEQWLTARLDRMEKELLALLLSFVHNTERSDGDAIRADEPPRA